MRGWAWWVNVVAGVVAGLVVNVAIIRATTWWFRGDYGGFGVARTGLVAMLTIGFVVGGLVLVPRLDPLVPGIAAIVTGALYAMALFTDHALLPFDLPGGELDIALTSGMPFVVTGVLAAITVATMQRTPLGVSADRP